MLKQVVCYILKDKKNLKIRAQQITLLNILSPTASGFASNFLPLFKARFKELREHTCLFKFINHPNECAVDKADFSYISGVSIRNFKLEVADRKALAMRLKKFKSLNKVL